jgi:hypothetical protein
MNNKDVCQLCMQEFDKKYIFILGDTSKQLFEHIHVCIECFFCIMDQVEFIDYSKKIKLNLVANCKDIIDQKLLKEFRENNLTT